MKNKYSLFIVLLMVLLLVSCGPKKLNVSYGNTCFNQNGEIVYVKRHFYKYDDITMIDDGVSYDLYRYLCKMDLYGNEEVIDIINSPTVIYNLSEGNNKICIQTGKNEVYTYINGNLKKVLDGQIYEAMISYDGEKIAYEIFENDTYSLCVSDINGQNISKYGFGTPVHWVPNNTEIVANNRGEYYLLDITTSNTSPLPYAYKWSHDLQRIVYYDETDHLVLMNCDETGKVVTDWVDRDHEIVWSYDGEYLLSRMNLLDKNGNYIKTLRGGK